LDGLVSPVLLKKGAEASLFVADWHGRRVVMKRRLPKSYRPVELDVLIRSYRTVHEPKLMHEAKKAGVPTPIVFLVDVADATIVMEFIEGEQVKQSLNSMSPGERVILCNEVGRLVGNLHRHGIVHGDLTTSNMIRGKGRKVFFVDFGLGEFSEELEARGVDLHLMKRALRSVHFQYAQDCFEAIVEGYSEIIGRKDAATVLGKVTQIERRGRYVTERKQDI
jgi:TP53 regulating kinase-like protein